MLLVLQSVAASSRVSRAAHDIDLLPANLSEYVNFHKAWKQSASAATAAGFNTCPATLAQDGATGPAPTALPAEPAERPTATQRPGNAPPLAAGLSAKVSATAAPVALAGQSAKREGIAPDFVTAGTQPPLDLKTPPLDLKALESRLRETSAIGVFTKLAIRNQIDDLLGQFRAYYQGRLRTTLAELRRPYELLLLKVLALLQDADPPLARAIAASREAIWDILSDPARFKAG